MKNTNSWKNTKYLIKAQSYDKDRVDGYVNSIQQILETYGNFNNNILPGKKEKFTVLRSPHVNKQSREQFEIRSVSRSISFKARSKTNLWLPVTKCPDSELRELLESTLPPGVEITLTRCGHK